MQKKIKSLNESAKSTKVEIDGKAQISDAYDVTSEMRSEIEALERNQLRILQEKRDFVVKARDTKKQLQQTFVDKFFELWDACHHVGSSRTGNNSKWI